MRGAALAALFLATIATAHAQTCPDISGVYGLRGTGDAVEGPPPGFFWRGDGGAVPIVSLPSQVTLRKTTTRRKNLGGEAPERQDPFRERSTGHDCDQLSDCLVSA